MWLLWIQPQAQKWVAREGKVDKIQGQCQSASQLPSGFFFSRGLEGMTKVMPRNFKIRCDKMGKPGFLLFIVFVMR